MSNPSPQLLRFFSDFSNFHGKCSYDFPEILQEQNLKSYKHKTVLICFCNSQIFYIPHGWPHRGVRDLPHGTPRNKAFYYNTPNEAKQNLLLKQKKINSNRHSLLEFGNKIKTLFIFQIQKTPWLFSDFSNFHKKSSYDLL